MTWMLVALAGAGVGITFGAFGAGGSASPLPSWSPRAPRSRRRRPATPRVPRRRGTGGRAARSVSPNLAVLSRAPAGGRRAPGFVGGALVVLSGCCCSPLALYGGPYVSSSPFWRPRMGLEARSTTPNRCVRLVRGGFLTVALNGGRLPARADLRLGARASTAAGRWDVCAVAVPRPDLRAHRARVRRRAVAGAPALRSSGVVGAAQRIPAVVARRVRRCSPSSRSASGCPRVLEESESGIPIRLSTHVRFSDVTESTSSTYSDGRSAGRKPRMWAVAGANEARHVQPGRRRRPARSPTRAGRRCRCPPRRARPPSPWRRRTEGREAPGATAVATGGAFRLTTEVKAVGDARAVRVARR
jgi:hypothetical protein